MVIDVTFCSSDSCRHKIYLDMVILMEAQGDLLDNIENQILVVTLFEYPIEAHGALIHLLIMRLNIPPSSLQLSPPPPN
ncbi:hypothetical protein AAG906_039530 [Vitis piasezkii]